MELAGWTQLAEGLLDAPVAVELLLRPPIAGNGTPGGGGECRRAGTEVF